MIGAALVFVLVVGWIGGSAAFIYGGVRAIRDREDLFDVGFGAFFAMVGLIGLLSFGAVVSGDLRFESHPDGCYFYQHVGKTTSWTPIACPPGLQP